MNKLLRVCVVVLLTLILGSCGGLDDLIGTELDGSNADVVVELSDNGFVDPNGDLNSDGSVTIDQGERIEFKSTVSALIHKVCTGEGPDGSQGSGVPPGASGFCGLGLGGGSAFWTPDAAGTWTLYCDFHPDIGWGFNVIVR